MRRKCSILLVIIFSLASPFHQVVSATVAGNNDMWAGIAVSTPVYSVGDRNGLSILFAVINDGDEVVDPKIEMSQLIVNGEALKESRIMFSNGIRTSDFHALQPNHQLIFRYEVGDHFKEPGIYKVSWVGKGFKAAEVTFRVIAANTN